MSATLRLFATVNPLGVVRELAPPHTRYEMFQMANRPSAITECPCANFFDPEVGGAYRERGKGHHPLCQWVAEAKPLWDLGVDRSKAGLPTHERPDDFERRRIDLSHS